jgi:uncharacterized protein YndB with AHSA1/START domain
MGMTENSSTNNVTTKAGEYELVHTRIFDAPRELVFEAWTNPDHLAKWWGPNGFTNSFHKFDMQPGGTWEFTMHGPDGTDYPNMVIFVEIDKPERIVLHHVSGPRFQITAIFEDVDSRTRLTFRQVFETARDFNTVKTYAEPSNEQNLDRLSAHLAKMSLKL